MRDASLKAEEARYLRNWIPVGSALEVGKGYAEHSTGGVAGVIATVDRL